MQPLRSSTLLPVLSLFNCFILCDKLPCSFPTNPVYARLGKWNVDPSATTVSGISNGGAFAVHISFIYSSLIHGAGIFAASAYPMAYCMYNSFTLRPNISECLPLIDDWAERGWIDSTDNLKGFKAFLYLGLKDGIISPIMMNNVMEEYKHYGADVKNNLLKIEAGHCMPTNNQGNNDSTIGWMQGICDNVGYDGVSDMFSHFYGRQFVTPRNLSQAPTGSLFQSDLSEFYPECDPENVGIGSTAWTYIPKRCSKHGGLRCKLHFAFHGYGLPFRARILANSRNAFVERAGYLEAADENGVILIFPESRMPRGYDIFGYTGWEGFVRKTGVQNIAIKKMIDRVIFGL